MDIDRNWMYNRLEDGYIRDEFLEGIVSFVEFVKMHQECISEGQLRCTCNRKKCRNMSFLDEDTVKVHLARYGFVPGYYRWHHHGEKYIPNNFLNTSNIGSSSSQPNLNVEELTQFTNYPPDNIPATSFQYFGDTSQLTGS